MPVRVFGRSGGIGGGICGPREGALVEARLGEVLLPPCEVQPGSGAQPGALSGAGAVLHVQRTVSGDLASLSRIHDRLNSVFDGGVSHVDSCFLLRTLVR